MNLVLSPAAISDLQAISQHTLQTWGEEQETRYLDAIWQTLEKVRTHPEAFRSRTDLHHGCRSVRSGRHVIFYITTGTSVEVIRILHAAMDFSSHLTPD
ncbi:MAG: type II toxin-antitoxin system RelE/ParE family toxin [Verrucomicrobiaceae bacterium]|nr:MAG: type II toxin-antitoxin system RelE/ParE family toxin [Verrucomicrobiaceae bacterium]